MVKMLKGRECVTTSLKMAVRERCKGHATTKLAMILGLTLALPAAAQFVQVGAKFTGAGATGPGNFGHAIAISADGTTAIIGGPTDNGDGSSWTGGAWIYVRSGNTWTQQGPELIPSTSKIQQGLAVAISGDGNTVLIGDYNGDAAWVYTRSGTTWTKQAQLQGTGENVPAHQGFSVALSNDGNTALVGGPSDTDNQSHAVGSAWVFVRSGTTWTQQAKLNASNPVGSANLGSAAALSSDGNTALIGGYGDNNLVGASWVFTRTGTTWTQQGKLTASDAVTSSSGVRQGVSVALSADGNTAAVGGLYDANFTGAVWIYVRSANTWTQQGSKLVGSGIASGTAPGPQQGASVGLSSDGNTVASGGFGDNSYAGAVWIFTRSGTTWTQQGGKLVGDSASGSALQGVGLGLSGLGDTLLIGGPADSTGVGAVWPFSSGSTTPPVFGTFIYDPASGNSYTGYSHGTGTLNYVFMPATPNFDVLRYGDVNGDSKIDLILYNSSNALGYTLLGNGDGTYNSVSLFWGPGFKTVAAGDLNGDGKTDFLIYRSTDGTSYTALSNGDGTFTYKYTLVSPGFTHMALADFSGDGKADVFYYNSKTGAAHVGISDGTGGFTFSPVTVEAGYDFVETGDINADGKADLLLYSSAPGISKIGISSGSGFSFTTNNWSPGFTAVKIFDFNGDGKADIALYNKTNALGYLLVGDGTGNFTAFSLFWGPGYDNIQTLDVNGDGKQDVIIYNSSNGASYTGISTGVSATNPFVYQYAYWGNGRLTATTTAQK